MEMQESAANDNSMKNNVLFHQLKLETSRKFFEWKYLSDAASLYYFATTDDGYEEFNLIFISAATFMSA